MMYMFFSGTKHYGNVVNIKIFYAENTDKARDKMVADYGVNWHETHVLAGVETFQITK